MRYSVTMTRRGFFTRVRQAAESLLAVRIGLGHLLRRRKFIQEVLERTRPARRRVEIRGVFEGGPSTVSGVVTLSTK